MYLDFVQLTLTIQFQNRISIYSSGNFKQGCICPLPSFRMTHRIYSPGKFGLAWHCMESEVSYSDIYEKLTP